MIVAAVIVCLTLQQARERWPHSHLYWHTVAHCWDTNHKHWPKEHHNGLL